MNLFINSIIQDWAYKVNDGCPDPKKRSHLQVLEAVLRQHKYPEDFVQQFINELEFKDQSGFKSYSDKHKIQPDTKVTIGGVETTAGEAEAEKEKPKEKEVKSSKVNSKENVKKSIEISKGVKEDLDFIIKHKDSTRLKSGAGSNSPSHEDVKHLQAFTEKRMEQDKRRLEAEEKGEEFKEEPYVHPDVVQREIDDKTLDESMSYLKENMSQKEYESLIKKFATGGAVPTHLTKLRKLKKNEEGYPGYDPNTPGYKRAKEIIRLYLKNDGKSPVTGKPLPLSHMEPDHRVPFTTAENDLVNSGKFKGLSIKSKKPADGNSIQEMVKKKKDDRTEYENKVMSELEPLQAKYDNPVNNMDLMSGPVNQFKGSLINDKLLNSIRKKLAKNPEEKRLKDEYNSERKKLLNKYHIESIERGDTSAMSERVITEADDTERNEIMKAHNYWHPNQKEMNLYIKGDKSKNIPPDKDYYNKIKAHWANNGINLPDKMEDVDFDKHPFDKWMTRMFQSGRSRGGAARKSPSEERKYMIDHFKKSGYDVQSINEENKQDNIVNEAKAKVLKELDKRKIAWLKAQLDNKNLGNRAREKRQAELDKLTKSVGEK